MLGQTSTTNNRQGLTAKSTITGKQEFLTSTGGVLNSGATLSGSAIPATGLTTAAAVQIVDGSGNQITSFGGGTQYTDGGVAPAHPIGPTLIWNNGGTWADVSAANPLPVSASVTPAPNLISTVNSSSTTLAGNAAFTGTSEDVSAYADIRIAVFSDVASATDGLSMQQSTNGTNWDQIDTYTVPAGVGKAFDVPVYARFFRIVYTNGATIQTTFRLQAVYHISRTKPSSQRPQDSRPNDNDMEENLAYGMTYDSASNAWNRTIGNNGVTTLGTQRVTLSSDSTGQVKLATGANTVGAISNTSFAATQSTAAALTAGWPTINGEAADVTGTFTNATQTTSVTANNLDGYGNTLISINGTYGTATAIFEGSDDAGTTWYTVQAARDNTNVIETGYTSQTNTSQTWQINNPGFDSLRVRSTAVASGTVNVRLSSSAAPVASGTIVGLGTAIPAGTNVIGHVITDTGSVTNATLSAETTKVIGTVNQGTSPWIIAGGGTAGSSASGVVTIQGIASGTVVPVSLTSTTITGTVAVTQSGTWTDTVTQATGTNLHMVVDSGTITTVSAVTAITNALPAGANLLGKVGIDQTTVGTTNGVSIAQIGATTVVNGGVAGTLAVGGITATGAAKTGNPVRIGAVGHTANPTAVTDGQAVDMIADKLGKLVTVGSIRDLKANQVTTITASTAETTIVTAGGASVFLDMYGIIITNTSATAVNVAVKDVTAGTTRFNFAVPAGDTRGYMLNESAAMKQSTAASAWTATVSASVTSVIITAMTVANL